MLYRHVICFENKTLNTEYRKNNVNYEIREYDLVN